MTRRAAVGLGITLACSLACGSGPAPSTPDAAGPVAPPSGEIRLYAVNEWPDRQSPTFRLGTELRAFTVDRATGALGSLGDPMAVAVDYPQALAVHPSGRFVYLAHSVRSLITAWQAGADGSMAPLPGAPFSTPSPYHLAVDPEGRFLFVASYHAAGIGVLSIDPASGRLSTVPGSPFWAGQYSYPRSVAVDPMGRFLFAATQQGLVSYRIDRGSGSLERLPGIQIGYPEKADEVQGLEVVAVHPSGAFVYALSTVRAGISAWRIDRESGGLERVSGSPFTPGPLCREAGGALLLHPRGRFLYHSPYCVVFVSALASGGKTSLQRAPSMHAFVVDGESGALVEAPQLAAGSWSATVADHQGLFLFGWASYWDVSAMAVDPASGVVSDLPGSPYPVGDPERMAQVRVLGAGPAPRVP